MTLDPFRHMARVAAHLPDVPQAHTYQRLAWWLRRALLSRAVGVRMGQDVRIDARFYFPKGLQLRLDSGVHIKRDVRIGREHASSNSGGLTIGQQTQVLSDARIDCTASVAIGAGSHLGRGAVVYTHRHAVDKRDVGVLDAPIEAEPVEIGNDVMIYSDVVILSGVHIGDGAIIGVRSVVTKDVAPYAVMAGVPATKVGERV